MMYCWFYRNTFQLLAGTNGKKMFVGEFVTKQMLVFFCPRAGIANRFFTSI